MNKQRLSYYVGKDCLVVILPTDSKNQNYQSIAKAGEIITRAKYGKYITTPSNYHPYEKLTLQENSRILEERNVSGVYYKGIGNIVVDGTDINVLEVIIHELLHAFSDNPAKSSLQNFTEFNEGLTQYLTVKIFEDSQINTFENLRYREYYWSVTALAEVIGLDNLASGYFKGDAEYMASKVDKMTKPNFFCGLLLSMNGHDSKTLPESQEDADLKINSLLKKDLSTLPSCGY